MDITVIKFLKTGEISIPVCWDDGITIYEMMYEYACTCSNDMMNHYNQVGVQKWSDLIAYGISRDEFNTVEIDEIVNVILYAYQGIRMWSRIVKMSPVVFDSITNYIRKQLVKETSYEKSTIN